MATTPQFIAKPKTGITRISGATSGNVHTAGVDGSRIDRLKISAVGTTIQGTIKLSIKKGGNEAVIKEYSVPAINASDGHPAYTIPAVVVAPTFAPSSTATMTQDEIDKGYKYSLVRGENQVILKTLIIKMKPFLYQVIRPLAPCEQAGGIYVDDGKGNLAIPLSYPTLEDSYDVIREVVTTPGDMLTTGSVTSAVDVPASDTVLPWSQEVIFQNGLLLESGAILSAKGSMLNTFDIAVLSGGDY